MVFEVLMKCKFCESKIKEVEYDWEHPITKVVFNKLIHYKCTNEECGHEWLPYEPEVEMGIK